MSRSKGWPTSKPLPSGCQLHNLRKTAHGLPHPVPECSDYLPPKDFKGTQRLLRGVAQRNSCTGHGPPEVCCLFQNAIGDALQSSTRAPQVPYPMIESDNKVDLEMLDVARRDPMAPASKRRATLPTPRVEPLISGLTPSNPPTLEPEKAAPPEELTLEARQRPLPPPGFTLLCVHESDSSPPEQADWCSSVPPGAKLDFASLESLQVTISHYPVMGKV